MRYNPGDKVRIKSLDELKRIKMTEKVFGGLTEDMLRYAGKTYTIRELDRDCIKYAQESYYLVNASFTWDIRLLESVHTVILDEGLFEL